MMRAAVCSILLAGCLKSPDGKPQSWPPPDGIPAIESVVAADLDGDDIDDLAVIAAGPAAEGGGVYLIRGGTDIDPAADPPILSFSLVAPLDLEAPLTALALDIDIATAGVDLVIAHTDGSNTRLATLRGADLGGLGNIPSGLAPAAPGQPLWLRMVAFPGGQPRLVIAAGADVNHMAPEALTGTTTPAPTIFPAPPPGPGWVEPQLALTFDPGTGTEAVVATTTTAMRSPIPTEPPPTGTFSWTALRDGPAWIGQTVTDLDGDGTEEILGFDPSGSDPGQICGVVVDDTQPLCLTTPIPDDSGIELHVDPLGGLDPEPDLLVLVRRASDATVVIFPDLANDSGALVAAEALAPHDADIAGAHLVIGAFTAEGERRILLVGADASAAAILPQ